MNEIQKLAAQYKIRSIDVIMIAAGYSDDNTTLTEDEASAVVERMHGFISDSLLEDYLQEIDELPDFVDLFDPMMIDPSPEELSYCEGCESQGVKLNAKGYCDACVRVARASGHAESVE